MRHAITIYLIVLAFSLFAQNRFTAEVKNINTFDPVEGAFVRVIKDNRLFATTTTTRNGSLILENISKGTYYLQISHLGFEVHRDTLILEDDFQSFLSGTIVFLTPKENFLGAAVISAVRAKKTNPIAFTNLDKKTLQALDQSKDFTFILNTTPSTVVSSDAGNGVGYTGITIRGIDPTRVNVTINGITLNDPESQGVFWVNMPDLVGNTESVQIQRGVGTSISGPGAFGASVNVQTSEVSDSQFLSFATAIGSFNTARLSVGYGTGRFDNGWGFQIRGSSIQSDGFIDRATSDLKSLNIAGDKVWDKSRFKFNILLGQEQTFQAWNGIPEPKFNGDTRELNRYIDDLWISGDALENLLSSNPNTYNSYTYPNEIDNYNQNHYQLFFDHNFDSKWSLNTAAYVTTGKGYFEQFRLRERLNRYDLEPVIIDDDTFTRADLVRRRWLDNQLFGGLANVNYEHKNIEFTMGGGFSSFFNRHFGEVIATEFTNYEEIQHVYYDNDAQKNDGNVFVRFLYKWQDIIPYIDLQYRFITYDFEGFDNDFTELRPLSTEFSFFNPRIGFSYLSGKNIFYGFAAITNREPVRRDFRDNTQDNWPKSEQLQNIELGYKYQNAKSYFNINLYRMFYINQLVLTGGVNDVGGAIRFNVPESWRQGIEIDGQYQITKEFSMGGNLTVSENKIRRFSVDFFDDFDESIVTQTYENTDIAFSPNIIGALMAGYKPKEGIMLNIFAKYVGDQYLDNTQSDFKKLDAFTNVDLSLNIENPFNFGKNTNLGFYFNNVLNAMYAPNGYTFGWMYNRQEQYFNYLYPMAGFNWMVKLSANF